MLGLALFHFDKDIDLVKIGLIMHLNLNLKLRGHMTNPLNGCSIPKKNPIYF